jgi:hypothetical protein
MKKCTPSNNFTISIAAVSAEFFLYLKGVVSLKISRLPDLSSFLH